jgi:hypothetical protein
MLDYLELLGLGVLDRVLELLMLSAYIDIDAVDMAMEFRHRDQV